MTYEEALKHYVDSCRMCDGNFCDDCERNFAIKSIEKTISERWHDIVSNPLDVPEINRPYVYAFYVREDEKNICYNLASGHYTDVKMIAEGGNDYARYIAWKYIDLIPPDIEMMASEEWSIEIIVPEEKSDEM